MKPSFIYTIIILITTAATLYFHADESIITQSRLKAYDLIQIQYSNSLTRSLTQTSLPGKYLLTVLATASATLLIGLLATKLTNSQLAGYTTSTVFALNPWTIQLAAFATLQMFSLAFGLLSLWLILNTRLVPSAVALFFSILFHPASLFVCVPLYFILPKNKRNLTYPIISVVIALILARTTYTRFYIHESFYLEVGFINRINELRSYIDQTPLAFTSRLLLNKATYFIWEAFRHWLETWDFYWWFSYNRYVQDTLIKELGTFYYFELPLAGIGLWQTFKQKLPSKTPTIIFTWILIASLPNTFRHHLDFNNTFFWIIPLWAIITGLGIKHLLTYPRYQKAFIILLTVFYLTGISIYIHFSHNILPVQLIKASQ